MFLLSISLVIIVACAVAAPGLSRTPEDVNSLPMETMSGCFVNDTGNVREAVGMVNYVF